MAGKLADLKGKALVQMERRTGHGIALAAQEELAPILERMDAMMSMLDRMPGQIETSTASGAEQMKARLLPMVEQIRELRGTLNSLPTVLSHQVDGIISQIQQEGVVLRSHVAAMKEGLSTLPDALAKEVRPILTMAERLDEVLELQRGSLDALHTESIRLIGKGLSATLVDLKEASKSVSRGSNALSESMKDAKGLPNQIKTAATNATTDIKNAAKAAVDQIKGAQKWWLPWVQSVVSALVVVVILGALGGVAAWHGMLDLRRPQPSAVEKAWESLYLKQPPEGRATMDKELAAASARK